MNQDFEKDLYLLFNMAFDGLDKIDLSKAKNEDGLEDVEDFLREYEEKPQVAIIHTRSKEYPKALLFRKMVKGKAVMFVFWKRGAACEGMAASISGVSALNEFMWVQDAKTGRYIAALKPKIDINANKSRQLMFKRSAIISALVEPLNRREYRDKFDGDILLKLEEERAEIMEGLKERGLLPADAVDPARRVGEIDFNMEDVIQESDKYSEFVVVQTGGGMTAGAHVVSGERDLGRKLLEELERESKLADDE